MNGSGFDYLSNKKNLYGGSGGGSASSGGGKFIGYVKNGDTNFPSGAEKNDFVKVDTSNTVFPFTIQNITFSNKNDQAIYTGTQWILYSFIVETKNIEVSDPQQESLTNKTLQNQINIENKEKFEEIDERLKKMYNFIGFISTIEPTGQIENNIYWYNSAVLPTTFPIQVKVYSNGAWSTETIDYTPANFDTWSNKNDDKGYYWFANEWNINDANVLVDNNTIEINNNGEIQLKDNGITFLKLNTGLYNSNVANENNKIPLNEAVFKELLNNNNSTFEYDNTGTTEDILNFEIKNNNNETKINKTINFNDKMTFKTNTQTLTNKTLSADDNVINDLEIDNFKNSAIATSITSTATNNKIPTEKAVNDNLLNDTNSNFSKSYNNNNFNLTINLKDNNNISKIDKTTTLLTKISDYVSLTDTDKLSFLDITTQELKDVALSSVNSYIQNKISVSDGLTKDANNVIKHSNSITTQTQKIIPSLTYDAQGHITSADTITFENSIGISANKIGIRNPITADATNGLKTFSVNDVGLITGYTAKSLGRGINDNNNVIGHSNNITAQTTQKIGNISFDAQGHITGFSERPILTAVDENSTDQQLISAKCFYDNSLLFEIYNIKDVLDLVNSKFSINNTTKYNACCILKKDKSIGRLLLNFYTDSSTTQTSAGWKRISLLNSNFPYKVYNPNNLSSTAEVARNLGSMWDGSGYSNLALSVYISGDIQTYYYNAILNKTGGMNIALDIPITKK